MNIETYGVEAQLDFPDDDLSDRNASLLPLVLANPGIVATAHHSAQEAWLPYVSRALVSELVGRLYDSRMTDAADYGAMMYQAMSELVCPIPDDFDEYTVNSCVSGLTRRTSNDDLSDYVIAAQMNFHDTLPQAAEVVREAATTSHRYLTTYAVLGAALSHQLRLDVMRLREANAES